MAAPTNTAELDPKYDDYDFPTVAPVKQDGHPGHLTPEQIEKVKQLRTTLEGKGYTDRLDTLTLVRCPRLKKQDSQPEMADEANSDDAYSCASCVRASSTLLLPRQCKTPPKPPPLPSNKTRPPANSA